MPVKISTDLLKNKGKLAFFGKNNFLFRKIHMVEYNIRIIINQLNLSEIKLEKTLFFYI